MVTRETVMRQTRLPHVGAITALLIALMLATAIVVIGLRGSNNDALTNQSQDASVSAVVPRGDSVIPARSEDYALRHISLPTVFDYRDDHGTRHLGG